METRDRNSGIGFLLLSLIPPTIYIALSFFMWLSFSGLITQFTNSSLSLLVRVGAGVGGIVLGVLVCLLTGELNRLFLLWSGFCHAFLTYIILITVALTINITNQSPMNVMSRGISDTMWQCMLILFAYSGVYMFGSKVVPYTLLSAAAAYGVVVLNAMAQFGPATLILDWLHMLTGSGSDTPATRALENHTLIFGVGVFVYYYLLNLKTKEHAKLYLAAAFTIVMLGFKRSLVPGVLLCWFLYWFFHRLKARSGEIAARRLIAALCVGMVVLSLSYLVFIRSGLLAYLADYYGLDTQGRVELYSAVEKAYTMSPTYQGKGLGWISRNMVELTGNENSSPQVHCNFLELYIELGLWGYLAFLGYRMLLCPRLLAMRYGFDMGIFYVCIYLYSWITYFTDNTVFYWPINLVTWLCVFSEIVDQSELHQRSGVSVTKKEEKQDESEQAG